MIRTTAPLAVLALTLLLPAQHKAPVVWHADFDKGMSAAKRTNKDLFVEFTGSDWCKACIQFDDQVLSKPDFASQAAKRFVLVKLDFPMGEELKAQVPNPHRNRALVDEYRITHYPTVLLIGRDRTVLARTGFLTGGPAAYVEHLVALHAAGKKTVEEVGRLQRRMKHAKPEEREPLVREALERLKSTEMGGPGWQALCDIAEHAFALDPSDERGLIEATLATLVDARKASPGVLERVRAGDPKNEKKQLERIVRIVFEQKTLSYQDVILVCDELDRLTAAQAQLDRDLTYRLHFNGAVWIDGYNNDLQRAQKYAKAAMELGPGPEDKKKLQAILDKR